MTTYQAKIAHLPGRSAPDEYDPSHGLHPPDDFVVARDADGNTLSTYGELAWDRTPYGSDFSYRVLYFDYWRESTQPPSDMAAEQAATTPQRMALVRELHWLMFILMYLRQGNGLSNGTLVNYNKMLWALARKAESRSTSIAHLLKDDRALEDVARRSHSNAKRLGSLLGLLKWLGPDQVGFAVVPEKTIDAINAIKRDLGEDFEQTPPLPTRIYSHVLSALASEISDVEAVADRILAMLAAVAKDPALGRDRSQQSGKVRPGEGWRPEFPELLQQYGLDEFWAKKGYGLSVQSMSSALTEMMAACMLQIQAFTGMRFNEAQALPHHCLEEVTANDKMHYLVRGRVTKLTGRPKRVRWVTSDAGRRAILLAQRISETIYELIGNPPKNLEARLDEHYLFISPYYCLRKLVAKHEPARLNLSGRTFKRLRALLQVPITENDLADLALIDPERDWRGDEDFQIGQPWTFTSHQLRRSLALYAHASGIVSLPTLRRQLQHITREMSLYYARGSAFAKDFIVRAKKDERHIGEEWQETQVESQYLGHKLNVEMGDPDELAGAYAIWFDRNVRAKQVSLDRDTTMKEFKQGRRAYRETFAGGCTKVGACDQRMDDPLNLGCLLNECRNQVIKLPKFQRIIRIQVGVVENLTKTAPELPETRAEQEVLATLQKRMETIILSKEKSAEAAA